MNEEEWLSSVDPAPMLRFLQERQTSERKLRLLACACCRQIWDQLPDRRSRHAVEVAERFADGRASEVELGRALAPALAAVSETAQPAWAAYWAANKKAGGPLENVFDAAAAAAARLAVQEASSGRADAWHAMQATSARNQAALVREVIGNPFRPVVVEPRWLTWAAGLVPQFAEGVYEDRAFDRMPVLGDAREEAGCTDEVMLRHCRHSPAEHVRGCWVVDALLARE
jgi:hypothetical protein